MTGRRMSAGNRRWIAAAAPMIGVLPAVVFATTDSGSWLAWTSLVLFVMGGALLVGALFTQRNRP